MVLWMRCGLTWGAATAETEGTRGDEPSRGRDPCSKKTFESLRYPLHSTKPTKATRRVRRSYIVSQTMANITNGSNGDNGQTSCAKLLWSHPDPRTTPMYEYLQAVNKEHNLHLSTYRELHQWSITNIDAFWQSVWKFVGVKAEGDASPVSRQRMSSVKRY
jgi:hypothetical protein